MFNSVYVVPVRNYRIRQLAFKNAIILLMRYIFFCFLQFIVNRKGLF